MITLHFIKIICAFLRQNKKRGKEEEGDDRGKKKKQGQEQQGKQRNATGTFNAYLDTAFSLLST